MPRVAKKSSSSAKPPKGYGRPKKPPANLMPKEFGGDDITQRYRLFKPEQPEPLIYEKPKHFTKFVDWSVPETSLRYNHLYAQRKLYNIYLKELQKIQRRGTGFSICWPQDHFSLLVVARRYSGKSVFVDKLVKEHLVSSRMDISQNRLVKSKKQFFEQKLLFSPTANRDESLDTSSFDEVYTTQADLERFIQQYKVATSDQQFPSTLIVLDDTHSWIDFNSRSLIHWFVTVNRHFKCSMIVVSQNVMAIAPSMRNNASEWCLFRCKMDEELLKIAQAFGTNFEHFYNQVNWDEDFNFLYMTLRKGPVTWFFEGKPKEGQLKTPSNLTFIEQDCTLRMKFLGSDILPTNSPLLVNSGLNSGTNTNTTHDDEQPTRRRKKF